MLDQLPMIFCKVCCCPLEKANNIGVRVILCGVGETQMNDEASACRKNSRGRLDIWGDLGAEEQGDSSRGVVRDGVLVSDVNVWGGDRGA